MKLIAYLCYSFYDSNYHIDITCDHVISERNGAPALAVTIRLYRGRNDTLRLDWTRLMPATTIECKIYYSRQSIVELGIICIRPLLDPAAIPRPKNASAATLVFIFSQKAGLQITHSVCVRVRVYVCMLFN